MNYLPQLAESIIRNLDPHVPYLRNACFKSATTLVLISLFYHFFYLYSCIFILIFIFSIRNLDSQVPFKE